jgi:sulfoxide reductase heme-binding subunit YedZ
MAVREGKINQGGSRRGPPLGRHLAAVVVTLLLILVFWRVPGDRGGTEGFDLWNKVLADTSLVLLCLILMLGAMARFVPRMRRFVPWQRELGIGMFVTAALHVVLLFDGSWGLTTIFFGVDGFLADETIWNAANWVGLVALAYALVLAATSNDFLQRRLGRGWKFLQRQAYTLFVLVWLHTAGWLLFSLPHSPGFIPWFLTLTAAAVVAQFAGFVHTVRSPRGPSPQRPPAKTHATKSTTVAVTKGVAVTALWGGLIIGVYALGLA